MSGNNKSITPIIVNGIGDIDKSIQVLEQAISVLNKALVKCNDPFLFSPVEFNHKTIQHKKIDFLNYPQYNDFIVGLGKIWQDDSYALICQHDGFPLNPECWKDEFFDYDYIGSPWGTDRPYHKRVGNGGFCLRSPYCLNVISNVVAHDGSPEDTRICDRYGDILRDVYGIKFAPVEVAMHFSYDTDIMPERKFGIEKTFGFHGSGNVKKVKELYGI